MDLSLRDVCLSIPFTHPLTYPSIPDQPYNCLFTHPPPSIYSHTIQVGGLDFVRVAVMPDKDQLDARERTCIHMYKRVLVCVLLCLGQNQQRTTAASLLILANTTTNSGPSPPAEHGGQHLPDGRNQGHRRPAPLHHVRSPPCLYMSCVYALSDWGCEINTAPTDLICTPQKTLTASRPCRGRTGPCASSSCRWVHSHIQKKPPLFMVGYHDQSSCRRHLFHPCYYATSPPPHPPTPKTNTHHRNITTAC